MASQDDPFAIITPKGRRLLANLYLPPKPKPPNTEHDACRGVNLRQLASTRLSTRVYRLVQGRGAHQRNLFALFLQLAAESFSVFHSDRVRRFFIEAEQHHPLSNCAPDRECTRQSGEFELLESCSQPPQIPVPGLGRPRW